MMPPQGPGAGASAPPPGAAPQGPPQGGPPKPPQGGGGAAQLVGQVHDGLQKLMPLVQHADPQGQKLFQGCIQSFQAFVQHMSQPHGAQAPQAPGPSGPMPSAGGPKAQPLPQG